MTSNEQTNNPSHRSGGSAASTFSNFTCRHSMNGGIIWLMNFDITPYIGIRESLAQLGIECGINNRHHITVSTQDRDIWPNCGNSFWITVATGSWHLFTWLPVGYRVPDGIDLMELCKQCMAFGDSAMYRVPKTIIDTFGLKEIDDEEAELVYTAMEKAK